MIPANRLFKVPAEVFLHKTHLQTLPHAHTLRLRRWLGFSLGSVLLKGLEMPEVETTLQSLPQLFICYSIPNSCSLTRMPARLQGWKTTHGRPRSGTEPSAARGAGEGSGTGNAAGTGWQSCPIPTPPAGYRDRTALSSSGNHPQGHGAGGGAQALHWPSPPWGIVSGIVSAPGCSASSGNPQNTTLD